VSGDSIRGSELTNLSSSGPAPLTDDRQIVMGVVSKGPLSSQDLWTAICQRATMKLMSVYNNGCFLDDDGNECDLRFGIEYRQTAKGQVSNSRAIGSYKWY
jgi:hypothetical protein